MAFPGLTEEEQRQYNNLAAQGAGLPTNPYQPQSGSYGTPPATTSTRTAATESLTSERQSGGYVGQGRDTASRAEKSSGRTGAARRGQHGMPFQSSNEWFGALDEYGGLAAAQSPATMFDLYGTEVLGLNPGSATGQFYAENYNPYAMGTALGQDLNSPDQRLAAGTWMANQLGKPGMTFFDPGRIVTSVLSQIAQAGNGGSQSGDFNQLSAIAIGPPDVQLQNIISFLAEALKGSMTPDVLGAYLNWIQQVGNNIVHDAATSQARGGGIAEFERGGGNIATALLQLVGPNGGL